MASSSDNAHDGGVKIFASAMKGAAVTASDATELDFTYLWVGTGGNLAVRLWEDPTTTLTLKNVANGSLLPMRVYKVMAATTAADIVGLK